MIIPLSSYERVGVSAMSGESEGRINEMQDERMGEVRRERWDQMG